MKTTYGVFIIDKHRRILVCHPTGHKPTQWDIPKGCSEDGELPREAMKRELYEETGINYRLFSGDLIDIGAQFGMFVYKHKQKQLYPFAFILDDTIDVNTLTCSSFVEGEDFCFPEVDSYSWIDFNERFVLHETQQRALEVIYNEFDIFKKTSMVNHNENQEFIIQKDNFYG